MSRNKRQKTIWWRRSVPTIVMACVMVVVSSVTALAGGRSAPWSQAEDIETAPPGAHPDFNSASLDGCPFISADGKKFFMASDRPGGLGGLDIWVSTRKHRRDAWGAPVNVGAPVNSEFNDFCPTLARDGKSFFFVSTRPGFCGDAPNADIYFARLKHKHGFGPVKHLGCDVNSPVDEHSPFPIRLKRTGSVLFFSSARAADPTDVPGDHDIYMSKSHHGVYLPAELVPGVNTEFQDGQPNVRRDGLELFFYSNRPGAAANDIYSASRKSTSKPWSDPVNLGLDVNSAASETRPSLSWDGHTLYFGSTRAGSSDIYLTRR